MKVSFSSVKNNYNTSFLSRKKSNKVSENKNRDTFSQDEIITARTKKALSECKYVVLGIGILYFAMKRNFKVNKVKNQARKLAELEKLQAPPLALPALKI